MTTPEEILYGKQRDNRADLVDDIEHQSLITGELDYHQPHIYKYFFSDPWMGTPYWQARGKAPSGLFTSRQEISEEGQHSIIHEIEEQTKQTHLYTEAIRLAEPLPFQPGQARVYRPVISLSSNQHNGFYVDADDLQVVLKVIDPLDLSALFFLPGKTRYHARVAGVDAGKQLLFLVSSEPEPR